MDFDAIKVGFVNLTVGNWDLLEDRFNSIIDTYPHPKIFYVVPNLEFKMSLAAALNTGFKYAIQDRCDYICYVADDARVGEGAVQTLLTTLEEQDLWFCGGTIDQTKFVKRSTPIPNKASGEENSTGGWDVFVVDPVVFETVGFFDESFYPAYYEDNTWARMIELHTPGKMGYTPIAMRHERSVTLKRFTSEEVERHHKYFQINSQRYFAMWGGLPGMETYTVPWNGGEPDPELDALKKYGYFRG